MVLSFYRVRHINKLPFLCDLGRSGPALTQLMLRRNKINKFREFFFSKNRRACLSVFYFYMYYVRSSVKGQDATCCSVIRWNRFHIDSGFQDVLRSLEHIKKR